MPALFTSTSSLPAHQGLGDEPVAVAPPAHVTGDGHRLAPGRGHDLFGHGLAGVKLAGSDDHVGARLGQRLDDGPADAARSPGDDGHLAGHVVQCREGSHVPIVPRPAGSATAGRRPNPDRNSELIVPNRAFCREN
jgi:hypothetical protein